MGEAVENFYKQNVTTVKSILQRNKPVDPEKVSQQTQTYIASGRAK